MHGFYLRSSGDVIYLGTHEGSGTQLSAVHNTLTGVRIEDSRVELTSGFIQNNGRGLVLIHGHDSIFRANWSTLNFGVDATADDASVNNVWSGNPLRQDRHQHSDRQLSSWASTSPAGRLMLNPRTTTKPDVCLRTVDGGKRLLLTW
jgi:hypothetical protein